MLYGSYISVKLGKEPENNWAQAKTNWKNIHPKYINTPKIHKNCVVGMTISDLSFTVSQCILIL